MTIPISKIYVDNKNDLKTEHISFRFTEDFDIGALIIADNTYDSNGKPTNKTRHTHAFAHQLVKKDELVVLWTKKGNYAVSVDNTGKPQHNFYWGLGATVWNVDGDVAHIIDVRDVLNHRVAKYVKKS